MFEQIREFINRGQKAQKAVDEILKDQACPRCGGINGKHRQVDDLAAGNSHMLTKKQCPLDRSRNVK